MSPAELYRRLTIPTRFRVLGYDLVPLSVGHVRLIDRLGLMEVKTGAEALLLAKLCSMSARDAERWLNSRTLPIRLVLMARRRGRLLRSLAEIEKAVRVLGEYLDESMRVPRYEAVRKGDDDAPPLGAPFAQHLRATLLSKLNYTPDAVDAAPYIVAMWDYVSYMELEGAVRIIREEDTETEEELIRKANELQRQLDAGEVRLGP